MNPLSDRLDRLARKVVADGGTADLVDGDWFSTLQQLRLETKRYGDRKATVFVGPLGGINFARMSDGTERASYADLYDHLLNTTEETR